MRSLESFEAVLILDLLDDEKQSDFRADLVGMRNTSFALKTKRSCNIRIVKGREDPDRCIAVCSM